MSNPLFHAIFLLANHIDFNTACSHSLWYWLAADFFLFIEILEMLQHDIGSFIHFYFLFGYLNMLSTCMFDNSLAV